jgi:DNA primase
MVAFSEIIKTSPHVVNGRIRCPLHDDNNPSAKVYDDGGYCFVCNKKLTPEQILESWGTDTKKVKINVIKKKPVKLEPIPPDYYRWVRALQWQLQDWLKLDQEIQHYCSTRGYTLGAALKMGLGCLPPRDYLLSSPLFSGKINSTHVELSKLKALRSAGVSHRLTIPIHDTHGMQVGFILRHTASTPTEIKYLLTTGELKKRYQLDMGLFNIHRTALRGRGARCLYLVEGQLDALHATALGFKNFVASGTSIPSKLHLEHAKSVGVEDIIFIPDNPHIDKAGAANRGRAKSLIEAAGITYHEVKWEVEKLQQYKDVDEVAKAYGVIGVAKLIQKAASQCTNAKREHNYRRWCCNL